MTTSNPSGSVGKVLVTYWLLVALVDWLSLLRSCTVVVVRMSQQQTSNLQQASVRQHRPHGVLGWLSGTLESCEARQAHLPVPFILETGHVDDKYAYRQCHLCVPGDLQGDLPRHALKAPAATSHQLKVLSDFTTRSHLSIGSYER
ncbi:hypothetical protein E2C01_026540 [Portunus trituberculatus]|uniref:Uncharacterized protein n=1 Tax=Portunus trituberculatus TaxID=210409 RepID=A0A5B7EIV4_PORTR|nr:hypothetical protein [Portunus trituberculatus]